MLILSLCVATLVAAVEAQLGEKVLLVGDFDAGSLASQDAALNLSSSTSYNIYQLDHSDNSIVPVFSLAEELKNTVPSVWQETTQNSSVVVVGGEPYALKNGSLSKLNNWNRVNGSVSAVYYDDDDNLLYLGGDLSYNDTHGAVAYSFQEENFHTLPFGGFNEGSTVNAINKYYDSIIFGGVFSSIGESQYLNLTSDTSNSTHTNKTSSSVRDVSQMIPIDQAQVSATAGDNAQDIVCVDTSNPTPWTLASAQLGNWQATLRTLSTPSKLRLYNSQSDSQGVSLFRIVTFPANGIMNLTYIDPETLELKHCDAYCPLLQTSDLSAKLAASTSDSSYETFFHDNQTVISVTDNYQDYAFVNLIGIESFQVEVLQFYGDNAALDGVELFRSGITVFANNSFNQQSCTNSNSDTYQLNVHSESIGSTDWISSNLTNYLSTTVPSSYSANDDIGIKYEIDIPVSGSYDVLVYTPGCAADNTCAQRGIVRATLFQGDGTQLASVLIYQTNEQEKYDLLFSGDIAYSDSTAAYIELTFVSSLSSADTVLVAGSVQFNYLQLDVKQYYNILRNNTALELNSIFEYSLNNFSLTEALVDEPIGKTDINMLGSTFSSSASVSDISLNDSAIIIAGGFKTDDAQNILGYQINGYNTNQSSVSLGDAIDFSGLSGTVKGGFGSPEELVLFGSGPIRSLRKRDSGDVMIFQGTNSSFSSIDVDNDSTISSISGFMFNNTDYLIVGESNSSSVFNIDTSSPFQMSNVLSLNLTGSMQTNDTSSDYSVVMGNIVKFDVESKNIMALDDGVLSAVQNSFQGISAAVYINDSIVAVAGESNIYSLENNKTSVLIDDLSINNGSVNSMMYYNNSLYVAFNGSASINGQDITSVSIFDLEKNSHKSLNETIDGVVRSMIIDPESKSFIIGGDFDIPGKCTGLCTLDADTGSVFVSRTLNSSVSGEITSMNYFADYSVLVGGNFTTDGNQGYLGVYNTSNSNVEVSSLSSKLPGPVTQFIFANETKNEKSLEDEIVILGSNYIGYLSNSTWTSLADGLSLDDDSLLSSISLVETDSQEQSFYNNQVLLLTGYFKITNKGYVSSAYYDGDSWVPLSVNANNLQVSDADVKMVMKYTSMFVMSGSFTSTSSHTSSATSSTVPTGTGSNTRKEPALFSSGQVVGVSLALAIGTTLILGGLAWLLFKFTSSAEDSFDVVDEKGQKMMDAVPPNEII